MAKKGEPKSDWKGVKDDVQQALLAHLSDEFTVAKRNNEKVDKDFQTYYDMVHAIRTKKPNDWESDIYLPEFVSRLLTQIGSFVSQYFSSTDYIEPALNSDDPKDIAEAKAAKKLLNTILNDKELYYYHKIVRTLMYVFTCGYGVIKGYYEQDTEQVISHYNQVSTPMFDDMTGQYMAEDGMPLVDPTLQRLAFQTTQQPAYKLKINRDRPNFDVYPVQCVYTSPEYAYSLNDKEYVIFQTERSLSQLKSDAAFNEYFNLNLLEKMEPQGARGESTYNRDEKLEEQPQPVDKTFFIREYWQKYWMVEKDGKWVPGIDSDGNFDENAELHEAVITTAQDKNQDDAKITIGFRKSKHTRRPMARFLCYIDMVNDNGFGDGEVNAELQKAIVDNYNLMNYRTRLAITPAFKGRRFSGIDEKIKMSPETVIMTERMDDLQEFRIEDNIGGGVTHHNLLASRMDFAMATSPQTMGMVPDRAETATSSAIINNRANVRINLKSMNLEFIGFSELYDMILTLVNDFMLPETLEEMIGPELAKVYNPKRKDKFRPVSQALDSDDSKQFKINTWKSLAQTAASIPNPKTPMAINYCFGQIIELLGGNFKEFKRFMFEEDPVTMLLYQLATGSKGGGTPMGAGQGLMAPQQNQTGLPMPMVEQQTREMAPGQMNG